MGNKHKVKGTVLLLSAMLALMPQKVFATEVIQQEVVFRDTIECELDRESASENLGAEGFMPSTGEVKTLVLLVDFPSEPHDEDSTPEVIEQSLNESDDGLKKFYQNASYGKLSIDSDVVGWYTAKYDKDYYLRIQEDGTLMESNDSYVNPYGRQLFAHEVMEHFDRQIDFSEYDSDKDGYIDGIYLMFNGYNTGWNTLWWSYVATERDMGTENALTFDQVRAGQYAYIWKDVLYVNTMIHETGHVLGLADYYDYDTSSAESGLGVLDVMNGNFGDHNAFSKIQLGWLTPKVVTSAADISLRSIQEYPDAAIIYEDADTTSDHYFLVEYITRTKNNEFIGDIPDEGGVRVFRVNAALVDPDKSANYMNYKYGYRDGEVPLIEAITDGTIYLAEKGVCTIYDTGQDVEVFLWKEGAKISANVMPSTFNYGETADELRYTGVQIEEIKIGQDSASMHIDYVSIDDTKKLTYKLYKQATETLRVQLRCDSEVKLLSSDDIFFYDADGNAVETIVEIDSSIVKKNRDIYFSCKKDNLKPNSEYTLRIPAHRIKDVLGNENEEEIVTTLTTPSFEMEGSVYLTTADYEVSPPIQTMDNKIAIAAHEGGDLKLLFIHPETMETEKTVVYQEIFNEEGLKPSSIELFQKSDNQILIRIRYFNIELNRVYLANLNGSIELLFEKESAVTNAIAVCEDGFFFTNIQEIWYYDFDKKTVLKTTKEKLGLVEADRICPLKGNQCLVIQSGSSRWDTKFLVLDNQLQVLKGRKYRSGFFFDSTENVVNAVQYSDNTIAVFSVVSNAKKSGGFINFYDINLNLLNRIQILDEGAFTGRNLSIGKYEKNLYITAVNGNSNISTLKEFDSGKQGYYTGEAYLYNLNEDFTVNQILNLKNTFATLKFIAYENDTFVVDARKNEEEKYEHILTKYPDSNVPGSGFKDISKSMEDVEFVSVFDDEQEESHAYGAPQFEWSEDGKTCSLIFTCANDESHKVTEEAIVTSTIKTEPTCKEKGVTAYTASCSFEGEVYTDSKDVQDIEMDPDNHVNETETRDAKDATCGEEGYSGDTYCKGCEVIITTGITIPKKSVHIWNDGVITKEPTTTQKGEKTYTCNVCKTTKVEDIPMKSASDNKEPDTEESKQPLQVGETDTSDDGKAKYEVTSSDANNGTVLYVAPSDKKVTEVTIPDVVVINGITYDVTAIEKNAFKNNKNIKSVDIGKNVKIIGANAFYNCTKLKTVKLGSNVTTIGDKAFYKCTAVTKVSLPSKTKTIGKSAFYGCKKVTSVTIGKNINKIGSKAFYGCSKLKTLTIKSTKLTTKNVGTKTFGKLPKSMTVKVPEKKFTTYKSMLIKRGVNKKAKFKKS